MAVIETDYSELCALIGKKVEKEKLLDRISMLGTPVDAVDGDRIFVEVFPNRPDCLSVEGLARAISGFLGIKTGLEKFAVKKSDYAVNVDAKISRTDRKYIGIAVMKGLKFDNEFIISSMQLQDKLATTHGRRRKKVAMGVYDLDKIRFPLAYTMVGGNEKFIPMGHEKEMKVSELAEEHKRGKEYSHLIEGWKEFPAYKDVNGRILCIIPITQADFTKVTEKTKNVMIEVTGTDWRAVNQILNILVTNWSNHGAELYEAKIKYPFETPGGRTVVCPLLKTMKMGLDVNYANKLLGLNLTAEQAAKLLERMRYGATAKKDKIEVEVPAYRTDILHPFDLVEDIAIAYGFEKLVPRKPAFPTTGSKNAEEQYVGRARDAMVGFGFQEVMTFMLTSEGRHYFNEKPGERITISNPLTQDTTMVRTRLLPSVLETLRNNKHHKYPQMLFEAGEVVEKDAKTETGGRTVRRLCAVIADASATFTSAQSVLEGLGRELGLTIGIKEKDFPFMIPGRSAFVSAGNSFEYGFVGEVHPAVLNALGIEVPVSCFEIELKLRGERE